MSHGMWWAPVTGLLAPRVPTMLWRMASVCLVLRCLSPLLSLLSSQPWKAQWGGCLKLQVRNLCDGKHVIHCNSHNTTHAHITHLKQHTHNNG